MGGTGLEISQLTISQQNATAPTLHLPNHREFSFKILSPQSAVCLPSPTPPLHPLLCQTCFWKKSCCSRKRCINSTWTLFYLSKYSAEKITVHSYQMCSSADRSSSAFVPLPLLHMLFLQPARGNKYLLLSLEYRGRKKKKKKRERTNQA